MRHQSRDLGYKIIRILVIRIRTLIRRSFFAQSWRVVGKAELPRLKNEFRTTCAGDCTVCHKASSRMVLYRPIFCPRVQTSTIGELSAAFAFGHHRCTEFRALERARLSMSKASLHVLHPGGAAKQQDDVRILEFKGWGQGLSLVGVKGLGLRV